MFIHPKSGFSPMYESLSHTKVHVLNQYIVLDQKKTFQTILNHFKRSKSIF